MPCTHLPIRAIATGFVTAVLLLATGCGRQTAVAPATPAKPRSIAPATPDSSGPPDQQKLDAAAAAIEHLGASQPDSFTGLAVDNPGNRVIVYRKPRATFDAALARLRTGVRIDKRDAPRSIGELTATRDHVTALMGHTTGYTIVSVSDGSVNSYTDGVVEVGVTGDLSRAKKELRARFGDAVTVAAGSPAVG
ncbi:hypothetical protein [Streptomyces alanosinicus]|uniref:Uncharacterized protein n=1 Tax=Streptomyces alanosinicus TaxID=68171 RepID=A0A918YEC3_9ACTN|nr:hypothetical protein [Streptomyces alanosinicus]GHE00509.1 hypothetical protein GCM10010339_15970 [Streptomyces alanosinicus]